jgi:hypothetical protein
MLKALGLFGGASVVAIALAAFISKTVADRSIERHKADLGRETERLKSELAKETETHKLNLKKREILYQKEIEAASAFIALHRSIEPKYSHPGMEWEDALHRIVEDFGDIEDKLRSYISAYGAALSAENRFQIDNCIQSASNYRFADHEGEMRNAMRIAEEVLKDLKEIEQRFLTELRN